MDVLVKWKKTGKRNIVDAKELKTIPEDVPIKKGTSVKMFFKGIWYRGKVLVVAEEGDSDSCDTPLVDYIPLSKSTNTVKLSEDILKTNDQNDNLLEDRETECEYFDDSDADPSFQEECEVDFCKKNGLFLCHFCGLLICSRHIEKNDSACTHINRYHTPEPKPKKAKQLINRHQLLAQQVAPCIVKNCNNEIFAACVHCYNLLCWDHFDGDVDCSTHVESPTTVLQPTEREQVSVLQERKMASKRPEDFHVEGSAREYAIPKIRCVNKQKQTKKLRNSGQGYIQLKSMNLVPPRNVGSRCKGDMCLKSRKQCQDFNDEKRKQLFDAYYNTESLQMQRDYLVRHIEIRDTNQKTNKLESSRRNKSYYYSLPLEGEKVPVCKIFFLNTLGISERTTRTALKKLDSFGVVQKEKRGGRYIGMTEKDALLRKGVEDHLKKYPKVESHYCRKSSSRDYLHPDLSVPKMYSMYIDEVVESNVHASIATYRKIFKEMNLSIHRPKKDQCSLCQTYTKGDAITKEGLKERYTMHILNKEKVREVKEISKQKAINSHEHLCAVFDLQQVIYLPISKESAIFYKRRLAVYNFTIYNIGSKDCHCYMWHEGVSKRGSSEIATCVFMFLKEYDKKERLKTVDLFADGCSGQNKNSIVATTLLYAVNNSNYIKDISLRFFEPLHGQSEGDSAHSAIGAAISKSGDLFVPSQLLPIIRLARRNNPYNVRQMESQEFLNFKGTSRDLRVGTIRQDDIKKENINWKDMVEFRVNKDEPAKIFFKTNHLQTDYRSITLKRSVLQTNPMKLPIKKLNIQPPKISAEKFNDLCTLCEGECPVVRVQEYANFYKGLPHL